jgi:hypothetical protein
MRKGLIVLLAVFSVVAFALPAMADVSFFGYARVMPTYYSNFDFDDGKPDAGTINEGGKISGEHIRGELRLGWKAGGDKWKIMMTAESDIIYNKNNVDRTPAGTGFDGDGATFGIERAEFSYAFAPALELFTGWPISAIDIGTGGLLYGDDHPIIGFRGKLTDNLKYQLVYITIQNQATLGLSESTVTNDWRVYFLKPEFSFGTGSANFTLNPIVAYSDNRARDAQVYYYGLEGIGKFGFVKPSFEVILADGEFRNSNVDISSYAAFAGVELGLSKAFNPYIAVRYTQGDDDATDSDAEGFVGITDIGRFTPLMGMDGNVFGEALASGASPWNSPLYSYAPDRAGGGNQYGGISNLSSGNNPGSLILAVGAKGALTEQFSYKAQLFGIWYDDTKNLPVGAGKTITEVDDFAGYAFDLLLKYDFSKNFSVTYIGSVFLPEDGIKDQLPAGADDTFASVNTLQLVWTY